MPVVLGKALPRPVWGVRAFHGRKGSVLLKRESAKPTPAGDAAAAALDKDLRRWRRLRELSRGWASGVLPHRFNLILKALVRTETLTSPWRARFIGLTTKVQLDSLLADAEQEVSSSVAAIDSTDGTGGTSGVTTLPKLPGCTATSGRGPPRSPSLSCWQHSRPARQGHPPC